MPEAIEVVYAKCSENPGVANCQMAVSTYLTYVTVDRTSKTKAIIEKNCGPSVC